MRGKETYLEETPDSDRGDQRIDDLYGHTRMAIELVHQTVPDSAEHPCDEDDRSV